MVKNKFKIYNNKKAWLRIVEAFIAIVIISTVLFLVVSKQVPRKNQGPEISEFLRATLMQISKRDDLRAAVITEDELFLNSFIDGIIPKWLDYEFNICDTDDICGLEYYPSSNPKEIYSEEVLISSSTSNGVDPKKLKLFVWRA